MDTAVLMAVRADVCWRRFRRELRKAGFDWHRTGEPWTVREGGPEHRDMQAVLANISKD